MNKASYDPSFDSNAASMEKFIDGIIVAANFNNLDHIVVCGYASPDGPFNNNDKLSLNRCKSVAEYISRHAGIPLDKIQSCHGGVAWDGLRELVIKNTMTPSRDAVLRILDKYLPGACTDRAKSDRCRKELMDIDNERTYKWMLDNLFPKLRYSASVYTYIVPAGSDGSSREPIQPAVKPIDAASLLVSDEDFKMFAPSEIKRYTFHHEPAYRFAVKTNLLYYAALLPNIELEWLINDNWSVALDGNLAWWGRYSDNKSYRLLIVSPEVRRWINPRAPWHGLYVGAFAGGGLYDFQNGGNGKHGEGAMAGLSAGYTWPIGRRLILEAEIGAGYMFTRYKEYKPLDGHHVYQRTKEISYFGPLKAKFSIGWRFFDSKKHSKFNPAL